MKENFLPYLIEVADREQKAYMPSLGVRLGRVVSFVNSDIVFVDFRENPHGPIAARLALGVCDRAKLKINHEKTNVLLAFENNDNRLPIIIGLVSERLKDDEESETDAPEGSREIIIKGKRIVLDSDEEVVVKCGKSKIVLKKDGKIVVRGKNVISRASHGNCIRGGTVKIN